jgi:excisionase family DNA binding protein
MRVQGLTKPVYQINKRLFSIKEAADYLGRSPWTVAEMVRTGKLPYVADGKRKFLDIQDIHKWIDTSKTQNLD